MSFQIVTQRSKGPESLCLSKCLATFVFRSCSVIRLMGRVVSKPRSPRTNRTFVSVRQYRQEVSQLIRIKTSEPGYGGKSLCPLRMKALEGRKGSHKSRGVLEN